MGILEQMQAQLDRIEKRLAKCGPVDSPVGEHVDQRRSPLGRKHNAIVRRRQAEGDPGAYVVGRRHFLSPESLADELRRAPTAPKRAVEPSPPRGDAYRRAMNAARKVGDR